MNVPWSSNAGLLLLVFNIAPCFLLNGPRLNRLISDDPYIHEKRALPAVVVKLLKGAKFMGTNPKSIELYEKLGGYGQALRDFQSAKFTSVRKDVNRVPHLQIENFKDTRGNPVWIGDSNNVRVELQYPHGDKPYDATIYIRRPWTSPLPEKIIYYKIRPLNGLK